MIPRDAVEGSNRVALRIRPADKAKIMRAVGLESTDLTDFILRNVLHAADAVIVPAEPVTLWERDSWRALDLLEKSARSNCTHHGGGTCIASPDMTRPAENY